MHRAVAAAASLVGLCACGAPAEHRPWHSAYVAGTEEGLLAAAIHPDGKRAALMFVKNGALHAGTVPLDGTFALEDLGAVTLPWPTPPSVPQAYFPIAIAIHPDTDEVWGFSIGALFRFNGSTAELAWTDPNGLNPNSTAIVDAAGFADDGTLYFGGGGTFMHSTSVDGVLTPTPLPNATGGFASSGSMRIHHNTIWVRTGDQAEYRYSKDGGFEVVGNGPTDVVPLNVGVALGNPIRGDRILSLGGYIVAVANERLTEEQIAAAQEEGFKGPGHFRGPDGAADLHPTENLFIVSYGPGETAGLRPRGLVVVSEKELPGTNDSIEGTWCTTLPGSPGVGFHLAGGKLTGLAQGAYDASFENSVSFGGGAISVTYQGTGDFSDTDSFTVPGYYRRVGDTMNLGWHTYGMDEGARGSLVNITLPPEGVLLRRDADDCS